MRDIHQVRELYAVPEVSADYIYIKSTNNYGGKTQTAYIEVCHNSEVVKKEVKSPGFTVFRIKRDTLSIEASTYSDSSNDSVVLAVALQIGNGKEDEFVAVVTSGTIKWHSALRNVLVSYGYSGNDKLEDLEQTAAPFAFLGYKGLASGYAISQFGDANSLSTAEVSAYIVNRTFTSSKDGEQGPQGEPGEPGVTYYPWIKYADALDNQGYPSKIYDTSNANTKYIGLSYNNTSPVESDSPKAYTWTRIRGEDGVDGTSFKTKGECEEVCADYDAVTELDKTAGMVYLVDDRDSPTPDAKAFRWDGSTLIDLGAKDGDAYVKTSNKVLFCKDGGVWVSLGTIQGPKGDPGDKGDTGPVGYPAGKWDKTVTYTKSDNITPYVEHNGSFWLLIADSNKGTEPKAENDSVWKLFPNYKAFFVELFFAEFAKLASAVMQGNYMLSQYGLLNGIESTSYEKFTGPDGNFIPHLFMDFFKGEFWAQKCHITGEVNATSGSFTNCKVDGTFGAPFSDMLPITGWEGTLSEWYNENYNRIQAHDNVILYDSSNAYKLSCSTRDSGRLLNIVAYGADITVTGDGTNRFISGGIAKKSIVVPSGHAVMLKGYGTADEFNWYMVAGQYVALPNLVQGCLPGFDDKVLIRGKVTLSGTTPTVHALSPNSDITVTRNSTGKYTLSWRYGYIAGDINKVYANVTAIGTNLAQAKVYSLSSAQMVVTTAIYNSAYDSDFFFEIKNNDKIL